MGELSAETAQPIEGWPPPDLPHNAGWGEREFGVFEDRLDIGLGIALVEVTRDMDRAFAIRNALGPKGHVRYRHVTYSAWTPAVLHPVYPPGQVDPS